MKSPADPKIRKIAVVLSSFPEDGGKFQYSLSILEALGRLSDQWTIHAIVLNGVDWKDRIDAPGVQFEQIHRGFVSRVVRKLLLALPNGIEIWRKAGRVVDPLHRRLLHLGVESVLFPGNDSFGYEMPVPTFLPIHDLMHRYESRFREVGDPKIRSARDVHYSRVCRYAHGILVDSDLGAQQVAESYGADRGKIHPLPFVAPEYVTRWAETNIDLSSLELPERFVFYPAQFWEHKNHRNLIEALSLLNAQNITVPCVLVGSRKNAYASIQQLVVDRGLERSVKILDFVSERVLVALYRKAVALVMPTFFGPTNIPPLEAFALGCPVLISRIYAIPQQVGSAALLFDPTNPSEIAESIRRVWNDADLREHLRAAGLERHAHWNITHFASRLNTILRTDFVV